MQLKMTSFDSSHVITNKYIPFLSEVHQGMIILQHGQEIIQANQNLNNS